MKEIGAELQKTRLARGMSLEEIVNRTHIQLAHLHKLESGEFDFLPRPYVVAFLKTFAQQIGLNGEALAKHWQEQLDAEAARLQELYAHETAQKQNGAPKKAAPAFKPQAPTLPEISAKPAMPAVPYLKEIALGLGMLIIMAALIYFMSSPEEQQMTSTLDDKTAPGAQSAEAAPVQEIPFGQVAQEVAAKTQEPAMTTPTAETLEAANVLLLTLQAQFEKPTRMRVVRDGKDTTLINYRAGETKSWQAQEKFNVRISVAGAVNLTLGGKNLGKFGQPNLTEYLTINRAGVAQKYTIAPLTRPPRTAIPLDSLAIRTRRPNG